MIAADYHRATKHSWSSVRSGGRPLDWSNKPLPIKVYPDLEPIPLPRDLPESDVAAGRVLAGHGGDREGRLDLAGLARLLFFSAGVTRRRGRVFFRAAPSAGALYPIELYVACADIPGLPAGLYHFGPVDFALRRLRGGDVRFHLAEAAACQDLAEAAAGFILTGIPWRTNWKYRERGYRHLFWDAGTILANLLASCEAEGLPARVLGGFADGRVAELLGLGRQDELPLALVPVGEGPAAPEAVPPEPLQLRVLPLSRQPVRYPGGEETHRAGELSGPELVTAWREGRLALEPAAHTVPASESTVGTLEEVILRRGSTRRFARQPVTEEAMVWCLAVSARPVPGDFLIPGGSLLEKLVAVHAVEGWETGAYRWQEGMQLLHGEGGRERTAYLCLEQDLGGEAAATVFFSSSLAEVLEGLGERGYRMAQLEAGIASGRLHLASYALGLGATGLTFYDDEVREYFRTDAEPMLATAVGVPAYRSHRGRRPSEAEPLKLVAG